MSKKIVEEEEENKEISLIDAFRAIKKRKLVDLTHSFKPGIPHFFGFPNEERTVLYSTDKGVGTMGDGFFVESFKHVGQWGTHVDPPSHFHKGLRCVDDIPLEEMILELVVIDIHEKAKENPDYAVQMEDIIFWEKKHKKKIPAESFVALRSDWSKLWPDQTKMENKGEDGSFHWPGWSLEVLKYLYEERNITASGHETTDTDPGKSVSKGNFECESYILKQDKYQIELLNDLRSVPTYGAIAFVVFPKPEKGSGFPARVFAVLP